MMAGLIWIGLISGWLAGGLVNYLADILPITRKLSAPQCLSCKEHPGWGYYFLLQPCRNCHAHPPLRAILVQLFYTIAMAFFWIKPSPHLGFWLGFILLVYFGVVVINDIEYRLVLFQVSFTGAILCLGLGWYLHGILRTVEGGALGFTSMLVLYFLGELYIKWISHRRGEQIDEVALGFGDVILAGVLGLLLGYPAIIAGLVTTILAGGLVSIVIIILKAITRNYKPFQAIPYAPFLILGAFVLLFFAL